MSKAQKTFSVENQCKEDFLRIVNIVADVLPVFKRKGRVEKRLAEIKTATDILHQDITNLKGTQKVILDDKIVQYLEEFVNNKTAELDSKDAEKVNLHSEIEKLNDEIVKYEIYAKTSYDFFVRTVRFDDVDFVEMTKEQLLACIFIGINIAYFVDTSRLEVERQKIFAMGKMKREEFKSKLKEIL